MRHALIKNGIVERVILVAPDALASMDPDWLAQWDRIEPLDEGDGVVEPGSPATINGRDRVRYSRAPRDGGKTREERIEERIAALEAKVP